MVDFGSQIDLMVNSMLTLENLWKLNNFEPNDQQEEAIRHVDGPLYITAGPGSGKTRVLLWRAVNLIVFHGVKPEEIYLSTFTEKAAHQLQEGLRGLLGYATNINGQPYDLSKMYIGTVHSLCRRILTDRRKFLQDFHANPMPSLMDELSQYFHVSKSRNWERLGSVLDLGPEDNQNDIINDIFETNRRSKHAAVTSCISFFNRCSEECIDPSNAIEQIENGDDALLDFFQESDLEEDQLIQAFKLYQAYLDSLQRSEKLRSTDFSLLQQEAYQVLHVPGHSPGSIALWDAKSRTVFSGDAVYDGDLLDALYHSNPETYRLTLERLRRLDAEVVHGGHYPSFGKARLQEIVDAYLRGQLFMGSVMDWYDGVKGRGENVYAPQDWKGAPRG